MVQVPSFGQACGEGTDAAAESAVEQLWGASDGRRSTSTRYNGQVSGPELIPEERRLAMLQGDLLNASLEEVEHLLHVIIALQTKHGEALQVWINKTTCIFIHDLILLLCSQHCVLTSSPPECM